MESKKFLSHHAGFPRIVYFSIESSFFSPFFTLSAKPLKPPRSPLFIERAWAALDVAASEFSITTVFLSHHVVPDFRRARPLRPPFLPLTSSAFSPPRLPATDGEMWFRVSPSTGLDDFF